MKPKTEPKETYRLTKKEFTQFAKALIAVPKKEIDKQLAKETSKRETKRSPTK